MLHRITKMKGFKVRGIDGDTGKVSDFYFDDEHWQVRYMVVATGPWLKGKEVLVMRRALEKPDWDEGVFNVNITREQIETSPDVDLDKPLSRRCLADLHEHYGWPAFWPESKVTEPSQPKSKECSGDPSLKSANEIANYHLVADSSEIGHVRDLLLDDEDWVIRYVLGRTGGLLIKRSVLILKDWIKTVDWHNGVLVTDLKAEKIDQSPPFDESAPISREYENQVINYYGGLPYWA